MSNWDTQSLVAADKKFIWHPFTNMAAWCAPEHEPIVLVEGEGAILRDSRGREYLDGNSSIWTNIHGHNHPHINAAIRRQLDLVSHTSFLGFTNPTAIELARRIVGLFPANTLTRVFYSDDGSTGMEAAIRIVRQYWDLLQHPERQVFVSFTSAYHGDTLGAANLGALALFGTSSTTDLRYHQLARVEDLDRLPATIEAAIAAVVIEPEVQGVAGIKIWQKGSLEKVREWCDRTGTLLIADEVLTGFGRTGKMFGCEHEEVVPDLMVLAKGLTGGYLACAMTLVTEKVLSPFFNSDSPESTLFYGHSYTGNALACAAANASLDIFEQENVLGKLVETIERFGEALSILDLLPQVTEVRQCGMIAGIELRSDRKPGKIAATVCVAARNYGLLTRPIRDVIVLMPPFCVTSTQLFQAVEAIRLAILEVCP